MLQRIKQKFRFQRELDLELTPGEGVRDAIIKAGYAAGNTTEQLVNIASKLGNFVDTATQLGAGGESASALGRIIFKTTK